MSQTKADRDLGHLYPPFAQKVEWIIAQMDHWLDKHKPGYRLIVTEGLRSASYQNSLYQKGRTKPGNIVTACDGYKVKSNHQSGLAVDVAPSNGAKVDWDAGEEFTDYLHHLARAQGINYGVLKRSGKRIDLWHLDVLKSDRKMHQAARMWLAAKGLA